MIKQTPSKGYPSDSYEQVSIDTGNEHKSQANSRFNVHTEDEDTDDVKTDDDYGDDDDISPNNGNNGYKIITSELGSNNNSDNKDDDDNGPELGDDVSSPQSNNSSNINNSNNNPLSPGTINKQEIDRLKDELRRKRTELSKLKTKFTEEKQQFTERINSLKKSESLHRQKTQMSLQINDAIFKKLDQEDQLKTKRKFEEEMMLYKNRKDMEYNKMVNEFKGQLYQLQKKLKTEQEFHNIEVENLKKNNSIELF